MGIWDNVKNIMSISPDDFDDEVAEQTEIETRKDNYYNEQSMRRKEPKIFQAEKRSKNPGNTGNPQMQVVLVRPDRFDDVTIIADHLNAQKSVVLNLEAANREVSRRILDFLSGVAYANGGNIRKVANSTYMIVSGAVDVMGEQLLDDLTDSNIY